jgi:hypothetical protein
VFSRCSICLGHPVNKNKCSRCKKEYIPKENDRVFNGKILQTCLNCRIKLCSHKNLKSKCNECIKTSIKNINCKHGKRKARCKVKDCGTKSDYCKHDKTKNYCIECSPNSKAFCTNCRIFRVTIRSNYLCSYCNPNSTTRQKTKEIKIKKWLEENEYIFKYNKNCNNTGSECRRYFPDFLFECGTFFIVLEVDEFAHSGYDVSCEKIRENNISIQLGLPTMFIRYNPDLKGINQKAKLKSTLDFYLKKEWIDPQVIYLFYK